MLNSSLDSFEYEVSIENKKNLHFIFICNLQALNDDENIETVNIIIKKANLVVQVQTNLE